MCTGRRPLREQGAPFKHFSLGFCVLLSEIAAGRSARRRAGWMSRASNARTSPAL
jgi:hypothetical protein